MTLLKQHQAAEVLSLGVRTLEKLRITGLGPKYLKMGWAVRYRPEDLEDWMAKRAVRSTSEVVGRVR